MRQFIVWSGGIFSELKITNISHGHQTSHSIFSFFFFLFLKCFYNSTSHLVLWLSDWGYMTGSQDFFSTKQLAYIAIIRRNKLETKMIKRQNVKKKKTTLDYTWFIVLVILWVYQAWFTAVFFTNILFYFLFKYQCFF